MTVTSTPLEQQGAHTGPRVATGDTVRRRDVPRTGLETLASPGPARCAEDWAGTRASSGLLVPLPPRPVVDPRPDPRAPPAEAPAAATRAPAPGPHLRAGPLPAPVLHVRRACLPRAGRVALRTLTPLLGGPSCGCAAPSPGPGLTSCCPLALVTRHHALLRLGSGAEAVACGSCVQRLLAAGCPPLPRPASGTLRLREGSALGLAEHRLGGPSPAARGAQTSAWCRNRLGGARLCCSDSQQDVTSSLRLTVCDTQTRPRHPGGLSLR